MRLPRFWRPLRSHIAMPKATAFYAVARGRQTGIFETWDQCESQTKGYVGQKFKKFFNLNEAQQWISDVQSGQHTSTSSPTKPGTRSRSNKAKDSTPHIALSNPQEWDITYSDGACKGNGQHGSVAGIGVWWGQGDSRNIIERCPGEQTNNRAELIAITRVLESVPKTRRKLLIRTDSQYSINCIREWLPSWRKKGFKNSKGEPVKNIAIIRYLDALLSERSKGGQIVNLDYVKGHAGIEGNEGADQCANGGCLLPIVPEQDWLALEAQVLERMEGMDLFPDDPSLAQPTTSDIQEVQPPPLSAPTSNIPTSVSVSHDADTLPSSTVPDANTAESSTSTAVRHQMFSPTNLSTEKKGFRPTYAPSIAQLQAQAGPRELPNQLTPPLPNQNQVSINPVSKPNPMFDDPSNPFSPSKFKQPESTSTNGSIASSSPSPKPASNQTSAPREEGIPISTPTTPTRKAPGAPVFNTPNGKRPVYAPSPSRNRIRREPQFAPLTSPFSALKANSATSTITPAVAPMGAATSDSTGVDSTVIPRTDTLGSDSGGSGSRAKLSRESRMGGAGAPYYKPSPAARAARKRGNGEERMYVDSGVNTLPGRWIPAVDPADISEGTLMEVDEEMGIGEEEALAGPSSSLRKQKGKAVALPDFSDLNDVMEEEEEYEFGSDGFEGTAGPDPSETVGSSSSAIEEAELEAYANCLLNDEEVQMDLED